MGYYPERICTKKLFALRSICTGSSAATEGAFREALWFGGFVAAVHHGITGYL